MKKQSKVVFWNIWGHRDSDGIHEFLRKHSDADILCLTEVTHIDADQLARLGTNLRFSTGFGENAQQVDGYSQLKDHFYEDFDLSYHSATKGLWRCEKHGTVFRDVGFGSVLAVRSNVTVVGSGHEILNLEMHDVRSRVLQWVVYEKGGVRYLVAHFHGAWIQSNTKGDHVARSQQSVQVRLKLVMLANMYSVDKVIFGGDFNLDINTEALRSLEGEWYRNLVKEFGITDTRTKSYRKYGIEGETLHADYVLVSHNVDVESFKVHNEILASDHAALVVEFS